MPVRGTFASPARRDQMRSWPAVRILQLRLDIPRRGMPSFSSVLNPIPMLPIELQMRALAYISDSIDEASRTCLLPSGTYDFGGPGPNGGLPLDLHIGP